MVRDRLPHRAFHHNKNPLRQQQSGYKISGYAVLRLNFTPNEVKGDKYMRLHNALCAATVMAIAGLFACPAMASEPQAWQLGLQEPAGSIAEKAQSLHNLLLIIITAMRFLLFISIHYMSREYLKKFHVWFVEDLIKVLVSSKQKPRTEISPSEPIRSEALP